MAVRDEDLLQQVMNTPAGSPPRHSAGHTGQPPAPQPKPRAARNPSAFVSGKAIDRSRPAMVRWSSLVLLLLSLVCTIVAFHGNDWQALGHLSIPRTLAAVGLQAWCTAFQWYNRRRKLSFWYIQAFVLDVIPSTYAFGGIVAFFAGVLLPMPAALWLGALDLRLMSGYTALVWVVAVFAGIQLARIPEDRLIAE